MFALNIYPFIIIHYHINIQAYTESYTYTLYTHRSGGIQLQRLCVRSHTALGNYVHILCVATVEGNVYMYNNDTTSSMRVSARVEKVQTEICTHLTTFQCQFYVMQNK